MNATQRRLLVRLATADPRFVSLSAPPGYGKTDLAGAWARRFGRHAVCDCTGLAGLCDFAARLLAALGNESDAETVGRTRLSLHARGAGEGAWIRAVLECWKARRERSLLVLRNAGAIARDARALALFGDLLAARPAERALMVSSNEPLPLEVARYVAPHQALELTREQLQLDAAEAAELLEGAGVTPATTERILALCAGSPIALQLLARIAHYETDVDRLLDRLHAANANLHHQLLAEVLSALTPEMRSAMLAVAAIPHASLEDIAAAAGIEHAGSIVDGLLRLPGFIAYDSGSCEMHPLLLAALRERHGAEFSGYVLRAARKNESHGDYLHAAELYGIAGDSRSASAALDRLAPARWQQPSTRLIDVLQRIPVAQLLARPNCWIALMPYRLPTVEASRLLDEATELQAGASPDVRRRLGVRRALLAATCNRLGDAAAALDDAGGPVASGDLGQERRIGLVAAALVAAKAGRFSEADLCLERADAIYDAPGGRFEAERTEIAVAKASMHGEWDELLRLSEERLAAAIHAGPAQRIVRAARTVAAAAWFRDDDERAAAARRIVEDCGAAEDDDV
ncbi:MAG TPA: hypothetical protein VJP76_04920, partial [Candidatus Tumulicola sp.]|nr:hypothetical protein [Candidatus Tumulicola sp.]